MSSCSQFQGRAYNIGCRVSASNFVVKSSPDSVTPKCSKPKIKSSKNLSIANATALTEKMSLVFSEIEDPRVETTPVQLLTDILIIGIL